jgi:nicotinamide mononucleotide (NMN) deamidase PncC
MAFGVNDDQIGNAIQDARERALAKLHAKGEGNVGGPPDPTDYDEATDEHHLVEYATECIKESFEGSKERRQRDEMLWDAHETRMPEMEDKEDWQSQIVLNKPWTTTLQATSIIRRGILEKPDFFTCEEFDDEDPVQSAQVDFWQQALKYWTQTPDVQFQTEFSGMAQVGFAVGQSMGLKFIWKPDAQGQNQLALTRFQPWKAYDDPDRQPGRQWSGLYNVHEDWVDYHTLLQGQEQGYYRNVDRIDSNTLPDDDAATYRRSTREQREEEALKNGSAANRNKFRKQILVREVWGTVLDPDGRVLYPNVSYTVAGNRVIRPPVLVDFPTMRWPWVEWCPLPHPSRFHGYGLYEGAIAIWKLKNSLLNLYLDNENYRINTMYEFYPEKLRNPADDEMFPGKKFMRKANAPEGPAVRPVEKPQSNLADAQFIWLLASQEWEAGSFVTEFVKGEAGSIKSTTATESTQKFQQAMGVFDSIGRDCENGAVACLQGMQEFLQTYWHNLEQAPFRKMVASNPIAQQVARGMFPEQRIKAMALTAKMRIRGISKAFEQGLIAQKLQAIANMATIPQYMPFFKHYRIARSTADALQLAETVKTEEEMKAEAQEQQRQMVQQALASAKQAALEKSGLAGPREEGKGEPGGQKPPVQDAPPDHLPPGPPQAGELPTA